MRWTLLFATWGLVFGVLTGFVLWGMQILPDTTWTWTFGEPIEMEGELGSPVLIQFTNGEMYYVLKYEAESDDTWYLLDYYKWADGYWLKLDYPLSLQINESSEIYMMPNYRPFVDSLRLVN